MTKVKCDHRWEMTNIRSGYLVVEGCFHCRHRVSFFSAEPVPPVDDYQEGDHFWSYLGSYQASKFDLQCRSCGKLVPLAEVMAIMLCMGCDPECGVRKKTAADPGGARWVYVALCANTSHAPAGCIGQEEIQALNAYFNQGRRDPSKTIVVVPCDLRASVDTCQGIVLADTGLTELY